MRLLLLIPIPPPEGQETPRKRTALLPSTHVDVAYCEGAPQSYERRAQCIEATPLIVEKARWSEEHGYDAMVVSCMMDPGVAEARRAVRLPVLGLGEVARALGPFVGRAPATFFPRDMRVEDLDANPQATFAQLVEAGRWYIRCAGADVLVPNCSHLGPLAPHLQEELGVPVFQCEDLALKVAELLVSSGLRAEEAAVDRTRWPKAISTPVRLAARFRKRLLTWLPRSNG